MKPALPRSTEFLLRLQSAEAGEAHARHPCTVLRVAVVCAFFAIGLVALWRQPRPIEFSSGHTSAGAGPSTSSIDSLTPPDRELTVVWLSMLDDHAFLWELERMLCDVCVPGAGVEVVTVFDRTTT